MGHTPDIIAFLDDHHDQLLSCGIPEAFWQTLYKKLSNQIYDAGEAFELLRVSYENRQREEHEPVWALRAIKDIPTNSDSIYLVDHFWTYRLKYAKAMLHKYDHLIDRLCNILDVDASLPKMELIEIICSKLWKINNYYIINESNYMPENADAEKNLPVWYVMDEVGCAITHNDDPNVKVVPFVYANQVTYSLIFPLREIQEDEIISRNYAEGINDLERVEAYLIPWQPKSFEDISIEPPVPDEKYFLGGHRPESLPVELSETRVAKENYKVFSQYSLVRKCLSHARFSITDNEEEADILWYTEHFVDFAGLSSQTPHKFVNQFPFEYVLTVKDLLAIICRRKANAAWYPITYNLMTELPNFVSYFQKRASDGRDNYWIVKPFNLARSLDTHITNNIDYILRVSATGPKIAQKYITNPVLFYRPECNGKVKFDVRYVVLLKSVKPLEAYVHRKFFLRFANQTFEMNDFDVYEKHFTVMNYTDEAVNLKHIKCEDFLVHWEQQYPDHKWSENVESAILAMLRDILECARMEAPPCGIAKSMQSRALYAADIILEWTENREIQPKILEINFTPDCQRACDYYPDFLNDIFRLLFLDENCGEFLAL